jgi:error-prone DNA polymerase
LLVYVSSWLKCHYPDIFAASLLNSQPMGFYQPAQIISDAKKHGVKIRPVDISYSEWDNTLEEWEGKYCSLRLGFRQIKGLNKEEIEILIAARDAGQIYIEQLAEVGISISTLEKLADADAFRSAGIIRRQALWEISALADRAIGLYKGQKPEASLEKDIELPQMSLPEHVFEDYRAVSFSLRAHPVSFVRKKLSSLHIKTNHELKNCIDGEKVRVAGLVLVRQRPQTANGICFITLEDETDIANLVVFENLFNKFRKEIVHSKLLMVEGKLQKEGDVIHVVTQKCYDLTGLFRLLEEEQIEHKSNGSTLPKPRVDAMMEDVFYKGRNFR